MIPLSEPYIDGNAWAYVKDCLDTGWVSSVGDYVTRFERLVAEATGSPFAVATSNGTSALHVALRLAGVQQDDEVIVSDLTFIAPVNAIRYCGAYPVLIDANAATWQIDIDSIEHFLASQIQTNSGETRNRQTGRVIRAILPVHILGGAADMYRVMALADNYRLTVVEDAAEAIGVTIDGRSAGTFGLFGCLSFNGNKLVTCGGGGAILTADEALGRHATSLTTQAKQPGNEYIHEDVGYNYRLTNIAAALGCAQMESLNDFVKHRRHIAARYSAAFASLSGIECPPTLLGIRSTYWLYTVKVDEDKVGLSARDLRQRLRDADIDSRPLWQPIHMSPAHEGSVCPTDYPIAESLFNTALSLPCSRGLSDDDQDRVLECICSAARC